MSVSEGIKIVHPFLAVKALEAGRGEWGKRGSGDWEKFGKYSVFSIR